MRIGLVTHNVIRGDGQGRVNYELVRHLLARGHDVELIAAHVAPELVEAGACWVPLEHRVRAVNLASVWDFSRRADALLAARADRYDATIACGYTLTHPHTLNAAHFVHGTWLRSPFHSARVNPGVRGAYHWAYTRCNARWERAAFGAARVVVAVSAMVRDELREIGVPEAKLRVVVNGVDLDEYRPGAPAEKAALRAALGLPDGVPLGLFVGDLRSPIKNLDGVLRGLAEVPGAHLAVAGRVQGSPYPALAERLGLAGRVHFLDFRRDVAELMRAADFFALASRRDSCPLVLLEALASGLPVITAPTVGTANLVGAEGGFVLDGPDDHAGMVHALGALAHAAPRRAALAAAARRIAERHGWAAMAEAYEALLHEALQHEALAAEPVPA